MQWWGLLLFLPLMGYYDYRYRRIPNQLTVGLALFGLIINLLQGNILASIYGLLLGGLLLIIPFALRGIGAGDVKLLAAVGAVLGPQLVLVVFLYGAIVGGGFALLHLYYRLGRKFPYGIPLIIGVLLSYLYGSPF